MDEAEQVRLAELVAREYGVPWLGDTAELIRSRTALYEDYGVREILDDGEDALTHLVTVAHLEKSARRAVQLLHKKLKKVPLYAELNLSNPLVKRFIAGQFDPKREERLVLYPPPRPHAVLVSLDMVEASFTALSLLSDDLVLNTSSWADLIGKCTKLDFVKKAPKIRHAAFSIGPLCPTAQRCIMSTVMKSLAAALGRGWAMINFDECGCFLQDSVPDKTACQDMRQAAYERLKGVLDSFSTATTALGHRIRFSVFEIKTLQSFYLTDKGARRATETMYVCKTLFSSLLDGAVEQRDRTGMCVLKECPPHLLPQATRFIKGTDARGQEDLVCQVGQHVCQLRRPLLFELADA